jgi:hypothetical protein
MVELIKTRSRWSGVLIRGMRKCKKYRESGKTDPGHEISYGYFIEMNFCKRVFQTNPTILI